VGKVTHIDRRCFSCDAPATHAYLSVVRQQQVIHECAATGLSYLICGIRHFSFALVLSGDSYENDDASADASIAVDAWVSLDG